MATPEVHELLLVEDNPADIHLFKLALAESDVEGTLRTAPTAERAVTILQEEAESIGLVFLDIDLPAMSGLDALDELRTGTESTTTPILIFSSSDDPTEVETAYELGANAYVVKRRDFEDTVSLVEALDEFWLEAAELPE